MPQFDGKIIYSTPQIQTIAFPFSSKKSWNVLEIGMFALSMFNDRNFCERFDLHIIRSNLTAAECIRHESNYFYLSYLIPR